MKPVLVKITENWADEMDIYGLVVYPSREYLDLLLEANDKFLKENGEQEMCIGTNEWLNISDVNDMGGNLEITEISEEEANFMKKNICKKDYYGSLGYGFGT